MRGGLEMGWLGGDGGDDYNECVRGCYAVVVVVVY
jgi:hypothetical protein